MAYSEAQKRAIYRYRQSHPEVQVKQKEYAKKSYLLHRQSKIAAVYLRREWLRLLRLYDAIRS